MNQTRKETKPDNSICCECCIIGAGPAGLGAALELVKHGVSDVVMIDKNQKVGGLARTETFDGVRFDLGPHRFFTKNKEVNKIWHETLEKEFLPVARLTRIRYKDKYFNYPIKFADLLKIGPLEALEAICSFLVSQVQGKRELVTFEDWAIRKFGRKLYEIFFKSYTEKIWGIPCDQIGKGFAAQRIQGLDALGVLKNALMGNRGNKIKTLVEEFDFPALGAGQMYEAMSDKIISHGAKLMLDARVTRFNRQDDVIKSIDISDSEGREINIVAKQFFQHHSTSTFFQNA